MKDKELKRKLQQLHIPQYDEHKLEKVISEAKKIHLFPENQRMTNTEFFFNQMGFISKKVWGLKIIFSLFILYLLIAEDINISNWMWTLIAIAGPILCLFNAKEICNVFQAGMLEIQIAAKHSFSKVLMIRLIAFGTFDLFFLICSAILLSIVKETVIWQIIIKLNKLKGCYNIKKRTLSVISLLFALILLAGCGKSVKVTEENVKELFTPPHA